MIRILLLFIALAGCSAPKGGASGEAGSGQPLLPQSYKDIVFPEFNYVAPYPGDYRIAISDSITLYAARDTSVPLINISFYFRHSAAPANKDEAAAIQLLSAIYAKGGSEKLSPAAVDDSLEFLSARISSAIGDEYSRINMNCLSRDFGKVLPLLGEIFNKPRLDSARLELARSAAIQSYAHRYDQPGAHLGALSAKVLYKPNPKLIRADSASLARVKRSHLLAIKDGFFAPDRVIIAASGDFNADSLKAAMEKLFAGWKSKRGAGHKAPPLEFSDNRGIFLGDKSISQANIRIEAPFVKRPHPDYYPAAIASYILGGSSFSSRLMNTVRTQGGLAYSIYSFAQSDYDDIGTVGIALQTKAESAGAALRLIREESLKLAQGGPTDEELAFAKKSLIESIPGMFETAEATANAFAVSELNGRSLEHYREYPEKLKAVTAEQARAMAAKYFHPDSMRISIVGDTGKVALPDMKAARVVPSDSLEF